MQKVFSTVLVAFIALAGGALAQTLSSTVTLSNPNPAPDEFGQPDEFGSAVAVVGGNVLVGAPGEDTGALNTGAVYLFDGNTGTLALPPIYNPTPAANARFGAAVAAIGNNLLIGAPGVSLVYLLMGLLAPSSAAFQTQTSIIPMHSDRRLQWLATTFLSAHLVLMPGQSATQEPFTSSSSMRAPTPAPGG